MKEKTKDGILYGLMIAIGGTLLVWGACSDPAYATETPMCCGAPKCLHMKVDKDGVVTPMVGTEIIKGKGCPSGKCPGCIYDKLNKKYGRTPQGYIFPFSLDHFRQNN